jgi:hypothetical protein
MPQASRTTSRSASTKATSVRTTRKPAPSRTRATTKVPAAAVESTTTTTATEPQKRMKTGFKLALTLALMAVIGGAAGFGTWSAFSATTENTGNTFATGTVVIGDSDGGGTSPMLALADASPGTTDTSCITVTYTGSLPSSVHLYGTTAGTGLDQYLNLVVTRGSGAAGFDDCTGFTSDTTDYIGSGNGVIYSGTLQGFPDAYGSAIVDPVAGSPESWTNPESHEYRFAVTVQDNTNAQGLNASQSFTWEARNN